VGAIVLDLQIVVETPSEQGKINGQGVETLCGSVNNGEWD
jgi:hypothetical protein